MLMVAVVVVVVVVGGGGDPTSEVHTAFSYQVWCK